jgi:hypothetical protein
MGKYRGLPVYVGVIKVNLIKLIIIIIIICLLAKHINAVAVT